MASRKIPTIDSSRRLARAVLPAIALLCLLGAGNAAALPALSWSTPYLFDSSGAPSAVSCASESACVAVDQKGDAFATSDPGAAAPSWSESSIDASGAPLNAVSCVSGRLCVAVDAHGDALTQDGGSSWTSSSIDGANALEAVSCADTGLCVAVDDAGDVLSTSDPTSGHWSSATIDAGHALRSVSCASAALCVAVDDAGRALWSSNPNGGASAWHTRAIDFGELRAVSCLNDGCVAVDSFGQALASASPLTAQATWSITPVDTDGLNALSCSSSSVCVAVDEGGEALASDDASAGAPAWAATKTHAASLSGVSCLAGGLCLAVDGAGHSLAARVPSPSVSTIAASEVGSSSATLRGSFDPHDALPSGCYFEYGTTSAYGSSVPCAALPSASGGAQSVNAAVGDLASNTTYHYRLRAETPSGAGIGADESFTTLLSSAIAVVTPHPSITGTPAVGQTLTCHSNVEASSVTSLDYAWLRDTVPVPGSTHSTYLVKGQDSGHHLQCQVTTTNGGGSASGKSGYVTIPVGGAPASAGETTIGAVTAHGRLVRVPLRCSQHASSGCAIVLELSYGKLTIAYAKVRLGAGASRTVTLSLSRRGRRVLSRQRSLTTYLSVTGTVIGVIKARLARDELTLGAGAGSARVTALAPAAQTKARASTAALAQTPYMGWDTYFALGGRYSESTVLEEASQLITLGLRDRGYRYVWLDVGWWHGARGSDGQIEVNATQWPHGLAWLTATLHAAGFRVGLYTDAGPNGCGGAGQGSYGHYQQDANTFAAWGFDAVKVDFCGGFEHELEPRAAYTAFHEALAQNASHRPMLLSICNFLLPEQVGEDEPALSGSSFASYTFGPSVGNSWRTDTDVGSPGNVPFSSVLRNMDADAAAPQAAGPGHWNDPDYLAPGQGMNAAQFRTQLSMWSMLAAPLMVSDDLRKVGKASLSALQNGEVLAIDQDPAGVQAQLLSAGGSGEVWVKPLADGERAVALLNRGSSGMRISTSASAIGLGSAKAYRLRDLWTHTSSRTTGAISFAVAPYSTVMLRVGEG